MALQEEAGRVRNGFSGIDDYHQDVPLAVGSEREPIENPCLFGPDFLAVPEDCSLFSGWSQFNSARAGRRDEPVPDPGPGPAHPAGCRRRFEEDRIVQVGPVDLRRRRFIGPAHHDVIRFPGVEMQPHLCSAGRPGAIDRYSRRIRRIPFFRRARRGQQDVYSRVSALSLTSQ